MLEITNPENIQHDGLRTALQEFRRAQVSRFPIKVSCHKKEIHFYDSRFPNSIRLGSVTVNEKRDDDDDDDDDEVVEEYFCIESRLIDNTRYVSSNDRKHQKHTKDPKKLLRYMRDYIRPFTTKEIASRSMDMRRRHLDTWHGQAGSLVRDLCNLDREDVMEEMIRMKAVGYKPQTEKFAQAMEQGIPAWEEVKRLKNRKVMNVHVFINPDESVEIYCQDKKGFGGINQGVTAFNSLAESPNCIQQQVAMLRMMDDNAFVPEVGTKVDASNYWVEVFPE